MPRFKKTRSSSRSDLSLSETGISAMITWFWLQPISPFLRMTSSAFMENAGRLRFFSKYANPIWNWQNPSEDCLLMPRRLMLPLSLRATQCCHWKIGLTLMCAISGNCSTGHVMNWLILLIRSPIFFWLNWCWVFARIFFTSVMKKWAYCSISFFRICRQW